MPSRQATLTLVGGNHDNEKQKDNWDSQIANRSDSSFHMRSKNECGRSDNEQTKCRCPTRARIFNGHFSLVPCGPFMNGVLSFRWVCISELLERENENETEKRGKFWKTCRHVRAMHMDHDHNWFHASLWDHGRTSCPSESRLAHTCRG